MDSKNEKARRRVSVLLATYNAAPTLRRALDSVVSQQGVEWECVVADGQSTDGTVQILQSYGERIRYVSEKDRGIFDALNKAVAMAHYEWVYILGADDELFLPTALADLLEGDGTEEQDVVYGNVVVRYPDGCFIQNHSKHYTRVRRYMFACHQGIVMKRKAILELGGFRLQYPLSADFDLVQRAYLKGYKFKQTGVNVAYYCSAGASSDQSYRTLRTAVYQVLKTNKSVPCPWLAFMYFYLRNMLRGWVYSLMRKALLVKSK